MAYKIQNRIPQLLSSLRTKLPELLLCRLIAVLLITVTSSFPTRVPGKRLVPAVLEGVAFLLGRVRETFLVVKR